MAWLFLAFLLVVVIGAKIHVRDVADYLSLPNTQAIKGVFILVVFFSHFNSYISLTSAWDMRYQRLFWFVGQAMVTLFLFYSGYGVMESIKRKGLPYVQAIPKKRVLSTLFQFDCAVLLYVVLALLVGNRLTVHRVLLSLIGWDSVGNSNWYIFVVLVLYLLTYFSFAIMPKKPAAVSVLVLGVLVCTLIGVTKQYQIRPSHWYDTALCYVLGMAYSLGRRKAEAAIRKHVAAWCALFAGCIALFVMCRGNGLLADMAANLLFAAAVVLFTMRITLKNRVLVWCGEHLFELYILQRIPMIVFQKIGLLQWNVPIVFLLSLFVTVGLSLVFGWVTDKAWKHIANA